MLNNQERYLVIMFPLNFNVKFSKTKVVIIIAFIWLLSACLALTPEFLVQVVYYQFLFILLNNLGLFSEGRERTLPLEHDTISI